MKLTKRICAAALAMLLCIGVLASCGKENTDAPKGMKAVESELVSFKLYIPEEWTADLTIGTLTAKAEDSSNVSVQAMTPSGSYKSADDYFRSDYYAKVQSTFANTALIEEECSIENQKFGKDELPSVKYVYTVESDDVTYKLMQYFTLSGGNLIIFTYTAAEPLFDEHLEEVADIVKYFEF